MEKQPRPIVRVIEPEKVIEGAGVKLKRSIATRTLDYLDPFLLFDHFGSENPADYLAGFPEHPHRGIETVTYMLAGVVDHRDSLGNSGRIGAGDVQWMTSGSGILHEEMPKPIQGHMDGFQLWVNLPAKLKMTRPRYQGIEARQIPIVERNDGAQIRVIAGMVDSVRGPVTDIAADPTYLDVSISAESRFVHGVPRGHTCFAYMYTGDAEFGSAHTEQGITAKAPILIVFGDGDEVHVLAGQHEARFLLISGKPLGEPIARYGPFVMNTRAEIQQALSDLRNGTFIRE